MPLFQKISFNKTKLPPYIFKFNVALCSFIVGWFALCLPAVIAVGCVFDESPVTYGVMIGAFALFFAGMIIYAAVYAGLKKRLVAQRAKELEEEFTDMSLKEAEEALALSGVLEGGSFVCESDVFGKITLPVEKCALILGAGIADYKPVISIAVFTAEDMQLKGVLNVDRALYNFIDKSNIDLSANEVFELFKKDKKQFTKLLFKNKLYKLCKGR